MYLLDFSEVHCRSADFDAIFSVATTLLMCLHSIRALLTTRSNVYIDRRYVYVDDSNK